MNCFSFVRMMSAARSHSCHRPEQAKRALDNFFREELLVKLRELALLQTADYSGVSVAVDKEAAVTPRIAVALPFDAVVARLLILRGSRLAGRMNTIWFGLYVRRRRDHAENMTAEQHRLLTENVQLAMSLGASVIIKESEDVVGTILDVIRQESVSLLVVGRASRRGVIGRVSPGIVQRLQEAKGFDLLIADIDLEID